MDSREHCIPWYSEVLNGMGITRSQSYFRQFTAWRSFMETCILYKATDKASKHGEG